MEWNKTYHRRKICIIFFSVVLMSMVLCGRLVYLMLFEGKYYETQAKDLQQRERKIIEAFLQISEIVGEEHIGWRYDPIFIDDNILSSIIWNSLRAYLRLYKGIQKIA